jgi:DHA1 family tetracycline resistance protein-like MFS transporter
MPGTSRAALPIVLGVVVVDLIGFGIVMPILPFLAREYGASATWLGLMLSGYAAAQLVFAPLWGRLSDRFGRRPVLLATIAGTAVSLLLLGLADSLETLFAARILAGAFAANVSVASAYVADATDESERTRWMGLLGAGFGVGFLLGPAIGGLLAPWGHQVPMLFAAGLAVLNWVHAALRLPETTRRASHLAEPGRREVLRSPVVLRLCISNLVFALAVTQLEAVFQFFMMDRFRFDAREVAFILVGMAAVIGVIQGGGMRRLAGRFPERGLIAGGGLVMAVCFAALPFTASLPLLLAVLACSAAGRAVMQPSLMSLASMAAPPTQRGAAMGVFQSSASLARVFGPFAAGWLYDRSLPAPFLLAAALALGVSLLTRSLPGREAADAPLATPVP